jgi:hypothetical protein
MTSTSNDKNQISAIEINQDTFDTAIRNGESESHGWTYIIPAGCLSYRGPGCPRRVAPAGRIQVSTLPALSPNAILRRGKLDRSAEARSTRTPGLG